MIMEKMTDIKECRVYPLRKKDRKKRGKTQQTIEKT